MGGDHGVHGGDVVIVAVYYLQIVKPEKGNGGEQHGNDYHCGGSAVGYGFTHSAILSAQRPLRREIPREAQYTGRTKMRE